MLIDSSCQGMLLAMSKFTETAATAHTLSIAAMEEASRFGQRTADLDHMFLALVVNEQVAGQVLRSLGITLDSAREAVAAQHSEQLASLGIDAGLLAQGPIVFHETGGYEWGERSLAIIKRASDGSNRGDAAAVLRELVAEPSGLMEAVLSRLGTTPESVITRLDEAEHHHAYGSQRTVIHSRLSATSQSFVPASVEKVWGLLDSPINMLVWEPSIGDVEGAPTEAQIGDSWTARAHTQRPDGKPIRVKPGYRTQRVELTAREEGRLIEWRFTYPDAPSSNARRIRVELEPAAGGTHLQIALAWQPGPDSSRRALLGLLMRPITRFAIWMQLSQLGGGISRAFR